MITYIDGSIFDSRAFGLVNPVNIVGVMGKGLSAGFKERYPEMFKQYQRICSKGTFKIGNLFWYDAFEHIIINFPTKRHWSMRSTLDYITQGLITFRDEYASHNITSVSFPMLGCGLGGLYWDEVNPLMVRYLDDLPIDVLIHTPSNNK